MPFADPEKQKLAMRTYINNKRKAEREKSDRVYTAVLSLKETLQNRFYDIPSNETKFSTGQEIQQKTNELETTISSLKTQEMDTREIEQDGYERILHYIKVWQFVSQDDTEHMLSQYQALTHDLIKWHTLTSGHRTICILTSITGIIQQIIKRLELRFQANDISDKELPKAQELYKQLNADLLVYAKTLLEIREINQKNDGVV